MRKSISIILAIILVCVSACLVGCANDDEKSYLLIKVSGLAEGYPEIYDDAREYDGLAYSEYERLVNQYYEQLAEIRTRTGKTGAQLYQDAEYKEVYDLYSPLYLKRNQINNQRQDEAYQKESQRLQAMGCEDLNFYSYGGVDYIHVSATASKSVEEKLEKGGICEYSVLVSVPTEKKQTEKIEYYYGNYKLEGVVMANMYSSVIMDDTEDITISLQKNSFSTHDGRKNRDVNLTQAEYTEYLLTPENYFGGLLSQVNSSYLGAHLYSSNGSIDGVFNASTGELLRKLVERGNCYTVNGVYMSNTATAKLMKVQRLSNPVYGWPLQEGQQVVYKIFLYDGKIYMNWYEGLLCFAKAE